MKLTKSLILAVSVLAACVFSACNSNDDPSDDGQYFLDIVTLESNGDTGAVLTFRQVDDSPLITLLTNQRFDSGTFKIGERIIVYYHPTGDKRYVSDNVYVASANTTFGGGDSYKTASAAEIAAMDSDPIKVQSIWRSGEYLNVVFSGVTSNEVKNCDLYLNSATKGSASPVLNFIFDGVNGPLAQAYNFYASFNIGELWNSLDTENIRVVTTDDTYLGSNTVTIVKKETDIKPIE